MKLDFQSKEVGAIITRQGRRFDLVRFVLGVSRYLELDCSSMSLALEA
jgi:predicted RNA-binding protein YlqC (UPF0109 family)